MKKYIILSILPMIFFSMKESKAEQPENVIKSVASSNPVGATVGIPDVSGSGAAAYRIPIEVPGGVNGLQPAIEINYNSQSGRALVGYGWSLSGTSSINRISKNIYHDGTAEAPQLTAADNVMLDGQRLMLTGGSNLTNGAKYRTEIETYSDITYKYIAPYYCFEVKTKDGRILEYGSTADSYIEAQGSGTTAMCWLLSKVTDRHGNTMIYRYREDTSNGEFYLSSIEYAGNRKVVFSYTGREDKVTTYFVDKPINMNLLLDKITLSIGSNIVKEFKFEYTYDGYYSKLTAVQERGHQQGARYNSTTIHYGYGHSKIGSEEIMLLSSPREGKFPIFADFGGNGKTGLLSYPTKSSYSSNDVATLYLPEGSSFTKKATIALTEGFEEFRVADLNGDGKMDLVMILWAANNTHRYRYYISNGQGFDYDYAGFNTKGGKEALIGDFNGDGKHEILVKGNQNVHDLSGNIIATGGIDNWGEKHQEVFPNNRFLCDLNGNGKSDILVSNSNGCWAYELSGNRFVRLAGYTSSDLKNYHYSYLGDFNGDGKTDILYQHKYNLEDVNILYSTGKGFRKRAVSGINNLQEARMHIGDFNRDGKSDVLYMDDFASSSQLVINIGIFNGTGFTMERKISTTLTISNFNGLEKQEIEPMIHLHDFDGDGRDEFCISRYSDANFLYSFNDKQQLHVQSITDGLGKTVSFTYRPLTHGSVYSETSQTPAFPVIKTSAPLYVVNSMSVNTSNYQHQTAYTYKDAFVHRQGKGFLGFGEITAKSSQQNRTVTTRYGYNATYFYPYVTEQKISTYSGSPIQTTGYTNSFVPVGNKRIFPYISRQTETDHLKGTSVTTDIGSLEYGSPKSMTVNYGSGLSETVTTNYRHITSGKWILGLPETIQKTSYRSGQSWTEKTSFLYNSRHLPESKTMYVNENKQVSKETYGYDSFGNVTSISIKSYNSPHTLTTTYQYSPDGIQLTREEGPDGSYQSYTYNAYGELQRMTSKKQRGYTTSYEYDLMGRLTKVTYPDGKVQHTSREWNSSVSGGVYRITSTTTGEPTQRVYYDASGRELRTSTVNMKGVEVHTDTRYNPAGNVSQVSNPFTGSTASQWNTYNYDSYERSTGITYASGNNISYSYSSNSVTETKDGVFTTRSCNSKGELIQANDAGGSITYNYRPDGQLSSIIAPQNVTTSFGYDDYGRQTSITDPSAGTKTFGYDDSGNINKETDANGKIKTKKYDWLGRDSLLLLPEYTVTYSYNDYGELREKRRSNYIGGYKNIERDYLGRVSKVSETEESTTISQSYTYNSDGTLKTTGHTLNNQPVITENYGYAHGHLTSITCNNISIWKLNEENAFGQPTQAVTGPLTRIYNYDAYGLPTERKAQTSSGIVQHLGTSFNSQTGNLAGRNDLKYWRSESFGYDNLNRLGSVQVYSPNQNYSIVYGTNGNLTSKTGIGTLLYQTPGKPYAVSGITPQAGISESVPLRNQQVIYTSFERPSSIKENGYEAVFSYGADLNRIRMTLTKNGSTVLTRRYINDRYETDQKVGSKREKLYLGGDAYTAPAVYVRDNNAGWQLHYICRDYLGSITQVTDGSGSLVQETGYDAWGKLRVPNNMHVYTPDTEPELFLGRGYTGHEHLPYFGLINMNARLYDPALGRFLSPDPYVQAPDFTQSFNRYSYCMNNPLKFTDPDGEIAWIPLLIVFGAGFAGGYVSHGVASQNWGMNAVYSGLVGGALAIGGYYAAGSAMTVGGAFQHAGTNLLNQGLGYLTPGYTQTLGDWGISINPVSMFTAGVSVGSGFNMGAGLGVSYSDGRWGFAAGLNVSSNMKITNAYAGGSYSSGSKSFSYFHNYYFQGGKQGTGILGYKSGDFSLQWENDVFAILGRGDRFRSNAIELGWKDYIFGTNVYTTDHKDPINMELNGSKIWSSNKYGTRPDGFVKASPAYFGKRSKNGITRFGWNNAYIGDFVQNGFHRYFPLVRSPFFNHDPENVSSPFVQSGRYLPYSIY